MEIMLNLLGTEELYSNLGHHRSGRRASDLGVQTLRNSDTGLRLEEVAGGYLLVSAWVSSCVDGQRSKVHRHI